MIDALYKPNQSMKEAGSEIIRHIGAEESDLSHQSGAANIWRFMIGMFKEEAID